jgi:transforming growth factor-beta-induced protein
MATSEMMGGGPFKIMTLAGVPLTFVITEEGVMINDTVMVTATDVMADNGIVHLINGILLPPAAE